ncbi:MAG: hypothetical protein M1600_14410 [Firmicutes bacterium]|nr:hypothetical protein [Bacillota bacterium]
MRWKSELVFIISATMALTVSYPVFAQGRPLPGINRPNVAPGLNHAAPGSKETGKPTPGHSQGSSSPRSKGSKNRGGSPGSSNPLSPPGVVYGPGTHSSVPSTPANPLVREAKPAVIGIIIAYSDHSLTLANGLTYSLTASAAVRQDGKLVDASDIKLPSLAVITLNDHDEAIAVNLILRGSRGLRGRLKNLPAQAITKMHGKTGDVVISGSITEVQLATLILANTTVNLAKNTVIRYRGYSLTSTQIPLHVQALALINPQDTALEIHLNQDPSLPPNPTVVGAVYTSESTVTIDHYTLSISPTIRVRSGRTPIRLAAVKAGATAQVHLNQDGQVVSLDVLGIANPGNIAPKSRMPSH